MNRRQFLYQALSVSAVAAGTGYATLDMVRRASPDWEPDQAEQARKAAQKALASGPSADEGGRLLNAPRRPAGNSTAAQPATSVEDVAAGRSPVETGGERWQSTLARQEAAQSGLTDIPVGESPSGAQGDAVALARVEESDVEVQAPTYVEESGDEAQKVRQKVEHFEYDFSDDVFIADRERTLLVSALERMNRVQAYVGHGNFNVLSFDDMLSYARYQARIGEFPTAELDYLEQLFYDDVRELGFFGERVINNLTHSYADNDIEKIAGTGHYLLRGQSEVFYDKVRDQVGDSLILTSGVRGVVKQYHLFMAKVVQAEGNISRASRSLAPPGHSYHAIGDFDVGRVGGGMSNFTSEFAETDEYKRLQDLGFVQIRYTADNEFGVRYEPWHIRVV